MDIDKAVKAAERGGVYFILVAFMWFGNNAYNDWRDATDGFVERLNTIEYKQDQKIKMYTVLEEDTVRTIYLNDNHLVAKTKGEVVEIPMEKK